LGQLSIVLSIARFKVIAHIIGLFFLWAGILYFVYSARDRHYVFITFSVLPFVVCTILTFAGRYIKRCNSEFSTRFEQFCTFLTDFYTCLQPLQSYLRFTLLLPERQLAYEKKKLCFSSLSSGLLTNYYWLACPAL
jgi:hypothetical protein